MHVVVLLTSGLLALMPATTATAHPYSISTTSVYITREHATASIEIFLEDLFLFHNLKPNDADFLDAQTTGEGIVLHRKFMAERFILQDVDGQTMQPVGEVRVTHKLPVEGVPLAQLMAHKLTFELRYEFTSIPNFLTIKHRFTDEDAVLPSEMRLQVKQENGGVVASETLLPDVPHSIRLNWENPPLSDEASEAEREAWKKQEAEQTLGISSYSNIYSFLYIDDFEVRHEILIPLLTLEESVLLSRDDDDMLSIAEQDAARVQIEAYFQSGNPVVVDGQTIEPTVQRCDFYGLDFRDFAKQSQRKPVSMASARVGIILAYPLDDTPQSVEVTWNRFSKNVFAVSMVVFAYDIGQRTTLTRIARNNVYRWEATDTSGNARDRTPVLVELRSPRQVRVNYAFVLLLVGLPMTILCVRGARWLIFVRLALVGLLVVLTAIVSFLPSTSTLMNVEPTPRPSAARSRDIVQQLQSRMYAAFLYRRDTDIYDALAASVDGPLLEDVYLEMQRSLQMQEQGGARSRIQRVEMVDTSPETGDAASLPSQAFVTRCRWNVSGRVQHWGHIHERTNQYVAHYTIAPVAGEWKVTNIELLDEERLAFETSLRKLGKLKTKDK